MRRTTTGLVSRIFPASSDAYHIFSKKLDGCIKPVLVPNAA